MNKKSKQWVILNRAFAGTMVTMALIEFSQVGAGLFDGIITSCFLGADAMAAVGICYPIFSIAGVLSGVLAMGMQSVCSKEIGKGNFKGFSDTATITTLLGFLISVLLTILASVMITPFVRILGARDTSSELFRLASDYVRGLSLGIPALIICPILAPAIQLDNGGRLVSAAAIISAVSDIILDIAAVKLNMGVWGMGAASAASYYINVGILLIHYLKKDRMLRWNFRIASLKGLIKVLPSGSVVAVRRLANVIRPLLINNYIIMLGGTAAMSALSIKNNVGQFAEIFGTGVAGAVTMMMGIAVGEKSTEDISHIGKTVHRITFIGDGLISLTVLLLARPIASVYVSENSEVFTMAVFAVSMMSLEQILRTLLAARVNYLNVISKRAGSQLLQFSSRLLAVVPCVIICGELFGVYGVLGGFAVSYAVLALAVYIVNAFIKKKVKVTPKDYLRLDDSFDINPGDIIELNIRDIDDAALAAEQVQMFCRGHRMGTKKSFFSALALDESIRLIYENNDFSTGTAIDLRLFIQNGDVNIRIRDNGNSAYPFAGAPSESDDPVANIGIKMLRHAAKDIKYYHTLNINYTMITV